VIRPGTWGLATLEDFRSAAEELLTMVDEWSATAGLDAKQFDLMGFSQGAAMTYTVGLLHPERLRRQVVLSGFLPENGDALLSGGRLSGKPVFVAHGRKDDMIPVELARHAVGLLKAADVKVEYCESDAGHKVSKECIKEMELFMSA
jgi:phospholipase/carboxylesterase